MRYLQIGIDAGQRERLPANPGVCPLRSGMSFGRFWPVSDSYRVNLNVLRHA